MATPLEPSSNANNGQQGGGALRSPNVTRAGSGGLTGEAAQAQMYCDDPICFCVGVERAVRMIVVWYEITSNSGLMVAKPSKWQLGAGGIEWLGIRISSDLGLAWVPHGSQVHFQAH